MTWTGGPKETLSAVALRAFRSPVSGLATMLAAIAADLNASTAAAHLVPTGSHPVELLAAGGPQAGSLGPPGRLPTNLGDIVRKVTSAAVRNGTPSDGLRAMNHWSAHQHVISVAILLGEARSCLLTVAGRVPTDAADLQDRSAAVGLLAQMVVHRRDIDRLRQELHDVQQDRSLLTAGLHHDLKGPLTSILGSARTLITRDEDLDQETKTTLLAGVAAQAERLNRMLTDTLERQSADPNAPVRKMSTQISSVAARVAVAGMAARPGEVVVESPDICVTTDEDRLERALLNLVDNALKYSPADVPVHVIVEKEGDNVTITVADNGPGVSSEVLPGLFNAYATDPGRSDGTGLGLHSVRTLIEELGGRVGYSRHSDWTRFTVSLPIDRED